MYSKAVIFHPEFYIATFTKKQNMPYLLFIHGGPGLNCGILEYMIQYHQLFDLLDYNLVLYDQRNCGKSKNNALTVLHQDNVMDLYNIIQYLNSVKITIHGLIGHSYGAKLLFDYCQQFSPSLPAIFVSIAKSIITPRLNNLMLDLAYLKKCNPGTYNEILPEMNNFDLKKFWEISEKLTPLFQENKDRPYLYWANLDSCAIVKNIQKKINQPINTDIFVSVRKDLYSHEENFSVSIDELNLPYLWINGFHDFIMNGTEKISPNKNIITFFQSAHYPHIEENKRFSDIINKFFKDIGEKHA